MLYPQLNHRSHGATDLLGARHQAGELFPDLAYRPHTRHIGRDTVVDDATILGTQIGGDRPTGRSLSMNARLTVTHDGASVHSITADIDPQPLLQALGKPVDAYALAVSQVQALRTLDRTDMVTYALSEPAAPTASPPGSPAASPRRAARRARVLPFLVAVVLAALVAGAGVWSYTQHGDSPDVAAASESKSGRDAAPTPSQPPTPSPTAKPKQPPAKKPAVVLRSDLAFGFDSAKVSERARAAVVDLARRARSANLAGTIVVEGFTDSLGSAAYGRHLSQQRADAVAAILREHLRGTSLRVTARGLGESSPIRTNATPAGRSANRRVTITLPSA